MRAEQRRTPGETIDRCQLCGRTVAILTQHHLIPRTRHKNRRNKKLFNRQDVRSRTIRVCQPCHKNIHASLTNKQLEREFNTLEALQTQPDIAKFSEWVCKKPPDVHVRVRDQRSKSLK